ncbi:MAG: sulfite exporter TauE/SafE family protein [Planctomycetota bacterium]|nr:sulfite exporter TauE/SafE family protein [Planctomycetota bacterium]
MFWWAVVFLDIFLIGLTKSGFGSGVGIMIVPIMAIALGQIPGQHSEAALGLLLPLLIAGDLFAVSQYWKLLFNEPSSENASPPPESESLNPRAEAGGAVMQVALPSTELTQASRARAVLLRLMPGTAVGVVLGGWLLWVLHHQANLVGALMRIEIGIEAIFLVSLHWWRIYRGVQQRLMPEPWRSHFTGGFSAISSTLAHAAGPIIAMYLLPLRLDRRLFVATSAMFFFILNTAKLPAYYASGQFGHARFSFTLQFLPLVVAGAFFGRFINRRLNDKLFTRIVYIVTFVLGWYILADGILRLFGKQLA